MNLVISTRIDPDFPLARLRGRGSMFEVRADDLRFTQDEAALLLGEQQPPDLSAEDVGTLCEHTEGWAVGLRLAALSMKGQGDVRGFISAFTGTQRHVMDYLIEEVLQKQTPEARDFLMKTSVLERLTAPLCDSVTGRSDSQDMLAKLESGFGGFLVPLDDAREWYRYHHLIAKLLSQQLERSFDAEETKALHLRAIEWFDSNDYPDDAIRLCIRIHDWDRAATLIETASDGMIKRGEWNTLLGWFQAIPDEVLRGHPRAYTHYANVLTTFGRLKDAEPVLACLEAMPNLEESLHGQLTFFRMSAAYYRGDIHQTLELAERALEQLTENNGAMRARALHLLGMFDIMAGRFSEGQLREDEAVQTALRAGESWVAATATHNLSNIPFYQGRLRQAIAAERFAEGSEVLARALYERNELDEVALTSQMQIRTSELRGLAEGQIGSRCSLAKVLMANGDVAGAKAEMEKADEASRGQTASPFFRAIHAANRVMFDIRCGDVTAAVNWGNQLSSLPLDYEFRLKHVPARLLIARGERAAAAEQLQGLYERTMQAEAHGVAIGIRVCQALAAASDDEALAFLADALKAGEPEGYIRTFVDEGKLLRPILIKAVEKGISAQYASRLIGIIDTEQARLEGRTPAQPKPGVLSEREMQILRFLADGLSNRQIATRLTISLSTAKTHVHNISQKLDVSTRTQILARAKELNLV